MTRGVRVRLSAMDIVIVAVVCLAALFVALIPVLAHESASHVKITVGLDGENFLLPLDEDTSRIVESEGHRLTVTVKDGRVTISESTCPDRVCVNSGSISRGGEIIVCVPAAVTVEILSESEDVDYVIG